MKTRMMVLVLSAAPLVFTLAASAQDDGLILAVSAPHEIRMTAKKYEFSPSIITVKKGERVRLIITATDHDHGFKLDAFHVDQLLKKGQPATIELTADQAGEFPFSCSHFCGVGHHRMKGTLTVQE